MNKETVVITGSARGLGYEMARRFRKKGLHVVVNGRDEKRITAQGVKNADVSGNDGMTTGDAVVIQKYLLHLVTELPQK